MEAGRSEKYRSIGLGPERLMAIAEVRRYPVLMFLSYEHTIFFQLGIRLV